MMTPDDETSLARHSLQMWAGDNTDKLKSFGFIRNFSQSQYLGHRQCCVHWNIWLFKKNWTVMSLCITIHLIVPSRR